MSQNFPPNPDFRRHNLIARANRISGYFRATASKRAPIQLPEWIKSESPADQTFDSDCVDPSIFDPHNKPRLREAMDGYEPPVC